MTRKSKLAFAASLILALATAATAPQVVAAKELSLAYFMGPKHPMNKGIFTPFGEQLLNASGGALTVKQFPGGALNKKPPAQYSILLDGVADVVFTLPGYTADVFPMTSVMGLPGICNTAVSCTEALQRARPLLESEYKAKVLAMWTNAPAILITKDAPVTKLSDLAGMKIRVASKGDVPFLRALGAAPIAQPVSVINQNLANGVIDAIMTDPSAIRSFKLYEPGRFVTTWFPGSGSAFVLLMSNDVYNGLSSEEKEAVDKVSGAELSLGAAKAYDQAAEGGLKVALKNGVELVEWAPGEREKVQAVIDASMPAIKMQSVGNSTIGEIMKLMTGD